MIQVQIKESAFRDLRQLDPTIAQRVYDKLDQLQQHPEPHKWLQKVEGTEGVSKREETMIRALLSERVQAISSFCSLWWSRAESNRRPPACKAGALPAELRPQGQF
jgi:hypothetical protein